MADQPSVEGFQLLFPSFASTSTDLIGAWLSEAVGRFTASRLGNQWAMVAYLYAAHQITRFGATTGAASNTAGPITSESVGDVSRSYGAVLSSADVPPSLQAYLSTSYGAELVAIVLSRATAHGRVIRTGSSNPSNVPGSNV